MLKGEDLASCSSHAQALLNSINNDEHPDRIELTTLHKSKGLGWKFVVVAYCQESILPHSDSRLSQELLEVERRLFYVGITRAKQKLVVHIPQDKVWERKVSNYSSKVDSTCFFDPAYTSRFIYEANIIASVKIATEISNNVNTSMIFNTDNRDTFNKYLFKIGKEYRISGLSTNE